MTQVQVNETLNANATAVFDVLGDFARIKVGGAITAFDIEGEGVGAVRTITMGDNKVIERLDEHDREALVFGYSILNEDNPLPVSNYSARVVITPTGENVCAVEWTGEFDPKGVDEETAAGVVRGIYNGGIKGTKKALNC